LRFIKKDGGPDRSVGHVKFSWSDSLHSQVGSTLCTNTRYHPKPCPSIGSIRHLGSKFFGGIGLPVTANPDAVGPIGGFGWYLELDEGAPRNLKLEQIEVEPSSMLLLSIAYPVGTTFTISARQKWCSTSSGKYTCREDFQQVPTRDEVRTGPGNGYHVDANGVVTFRVFQQALRFTGNPDFLVPTYDTAPRPGYDHDVAVPRFERGGVLLPEPSYRDGTYIELIADCPGTGDYCEGTVISDYNPDVCPNGYEQVGYDKCCDLSSPSNPVCVFADGSTR